MIHDDDGTKLRTRCVALLFDCPKRQHEADCPFAQIRDDEDVVKRVDWLKGQTQQEVTALLTQHVQCYARRRAVLRS